MARTKGSANFAGSLEVLAGAPLDAREVVGTVADLTTAATFDYVYVGLKVYVKENHKIYVLNALDFTDSSNWSEVGSGSGGTSDYDDLTDKPQINSVTLSGNKSLSDLGIAAADDIPGVATTSAPGIVQPDGTSVTINNGVISAVGGGGGSYTAGDGIVIDNNEISTDNMPSTDISDVIYPLPGVMARSIYNNRFNRSDMYDTNEVLIGKWIDGKPLYQKTIEFGTLPNATTKNVNHGIENVDKIWVYDGYACSNNNYFMPVYANTGYAENNFNIFVNSTYIRFTTGINRTDFSAIVTVRYTKTTDGTTKVSFDKDYSTDETIVGTWIDGKPLYQKVISNLNLGLSWHSQYNTETSSIDLTDYISDIDTIINGFAIEEYGLSFPIIFDGTSFTSVKIKSFVGGTIITFVIQYTKTTD